MTAPNVAETPQDAPDAPIPDEMWAQVFENAAARNGRIADDPSPTPAPEGAPAPDKATDAAPDAGSTTPQDGTTPETTPDGATAPEADPFEAMAKDAAPLTYTVNGESRTFDGILEVTGKGAFIPADKLDDVRNRIAREESNAGAMKDLFADRQRYERLGGYDGLVGKLETAAQTNASALYILDAIRRDPTQFVMVEGNAIVPNQQTLNLLIRESINAAKEAQWSWRKEHEALAKSGVQGETEAQVREVAVPNALRQYFPQAHADDVATIAEHREAYQFVVTPEQAKAHGWPVGQLMVDLPKMQAFIRKNDERRAQASATEAAKAKAAAENARRTAPPKAVAPKPKTPPSRPRNEDGTFAEAPRLNASEIFDRARAGLSIRSTPPDDE